MNSAPLPVTKDIPAHHRNGNETASVEVTVFSEAVVAHPTVFV
jgi:hypothetical protein